MLEAYSSSATVHERQQYYAYGAKRGGGTLQTDQLFTGQKQDSTGLMYYRARYYDPYRGQFISPDTIVPDATNVLDYNRFMMVRGNPLRYNDPTGHQCQSATVTPSPQSFACEFGGGGGGLRIRPGRAAVAFGVGGALGAGAAEVIDALDADQQDVESYPLPQPSQPSATGFPAITDEDDGLLSTPSSPAPGMDVLAEPNQQTEGVGSNILEAGIVQRGGNTFSSQAAKRLNKTNGTNYHWRDFGRALEEIKDAFGISHDNHSSRIWDNGDVDYEIDGEWQNVDNLFDWLE